MAATSVESKGSSIYREMGRLLDRKIESDADVLRLAQKGVSVRSLKRATHRLGVPSSAIIPDTTLRRRQLDKQPLTTQETERLVRLGRVYAQAMTLFGDSAATVAWLHAPADFLGDGRPVAPFEMASTESGARFVESVLGRTAHGFVA